MFVVLQRCRSLGLAALLLFLSAMPTTAQSTPSWEVTDREGIFIEGELISLSPDGRWIAGIDMDGSFCVWELATEDSRCDGTSLDIDVTSVRWSPDSTAVAFSQGPTFYGYDSDIFVFERKTGILTNLTDDEYEGGTLRPPSDLATLAVDVYPTWSADSRSLTFIRCDFVTTSRFFTTELVSIPRAGGEPVQRYAMREPEPLTMNWSTFSLKDGSLLFTVSMIDDADPANGIWILDPAGEPRQLLAATPDEGIKWVRMIRIVETATTTLVSGEGVDPVTKESVGFVLDVGTGAVTWVASNPVMGFSPDGRSTLAWVEEDGSELLTITDASGNATEVTGGQDLSRGGFRGYDWAENNTILIPIFKASYNDGGGLLITVRPAAEATPATT